MPKETMINLIETRVEVGDDEDDEFGDDMPGYEATKPSLMKGSYCHDP
jgi:hypothetical protein